MTKKEELLYILLSGLALTVYATTWHERYDYTSVVTATASLGDVEYAKFHYFPGNESSTYCRTYTSVKLASKQYGYAASTTTALNNESVHKYWGGQATYAGWISSPYATITGQQYAKSVYFYADLRSSSNNISTVFEVYGKGTY